MKRDVKLPTYLLQWLPLAFIITIVFGTIYATAQFSLRSSADISQVQMVEEAVDKLNAGAAPDTVLPNGASVDLRNNLGTFLIVYDESGGLLASNARLDGETVDVPRGVLEHARNVRDHRVTWQPAPKVRSDIVVKHFSNAASGGFVVAGHSLREVEKQEDVVFWAATIGWFMCLFGSLSGIFILERLSAKKAE